MNDKVWVRIGTCGHLEIWYTNINATWDAQTWTQLRCFSCDGKPETQCDKRRLDWKNR